MTRILLELSKNGYMLLFLLLIGLVTSSTHAQTCPGGLGPVVNVASLPYTGTNLTTCGAGNELTSANTITCGSSSYLGGEDLVFIFTPTATGLTTISLTSGSSWIGLKLYAGCPFIGQGGTCVSNVESSAGNQSMNAGVTAGVTYYLVVDTWPTPNCIPSFNLTISAPTPPPSCPSGLGTYNNITLPYSGTGLTTCGKGNTLTSSNVSPICGSTYYYGGEDDVYIFTPTSSGAYTIALTSSSSYVGIMLYAGCPLAGNGATCVGYSQSSGGNQTINATLTAGVTYYLIVDTWPSPTCIPSFNLNISGGAPGPCDNIVSLPCGTSATATMSGTGSLASSSACGWSTPGQEKIYSFTPTASGNATLVVSSTNSAGYVDYQYKAASGGCNGTGWTCIIDLFSPGSATFPVTAGVTYYLLLDPETTSSVTHTFQVNCPSLGSVITMNCPAAVSVSCASQVPPPNPGSVIASTTCSPTTVTVIHLSDVISAQTCANRYTITRTYRASDACGTTKTCTQTITVNDQTPPVVNCPANVNVKCAAQVPVVNLNQVTGADNCTGSVTFSYLGEVISDQLCDNQYKITRTFRGTDACGNSATCAQVIEVKDDVKPVLGTIPADVTLSCTDPIPAPPVVTGTDNCAGSVSVTFKETSTQSDYPTLCRAYSYEITRVWTAKDACKNTSFKVQKITVQDTKAPEFTYTPPQFITVECDDDGSNNEDPIAVDDCDGNPSVILNVKYKFGLEGCAGNYIAAYTWTAGDKCGNTSQYTQYITVIDSEAPQIKCPNNVEVSSPIPIAVTWQSPKGSDYCDGPIIPVQIQGPPPGSIFPAPSKTIIVYQATDNCGNVSTCSFLVIVRTGNEGYVTGIGSETSLNNAVQSSQSDAATYLGMTTLYQNEPNPFGNNTTIRFDLETAGTAVIQIMDITGKTIRQIQGEYPSGKNFINIDNSQLPASGMYYYQLRTKDFNDTKKMLYIK
ncbi:MAG TPA: T9SS type A sorting domain-containing protein [Saprospiraceae bacterium]|nr:T9SS type A sorting domain-containing protein [Saprospiraceae bacterium]MCC6687584.1 T9SS type A sorting domain-containing protein [Saprospiraceae bacterium]HMV22976.1 T9SS type A sorting domain-containing protein [Saprospiraceae bacterium]HMW74267.1 T9SS type A sorting domain-containing protein [Saprospiraceae bacterium]HMX82748.1 T9SS type A sorting domain-containing protein [Saprospiraceae bacterium]